MPTAMPARHWPADSAGRRQDNWLLLVARIILAEIHRVLIDAFEQKPRDIGHPRFGVAIGGGAIAVDIAKIALAIDERIARGKILARRTKAS